MNCPACLGLLYPGRMWALEEQTEDGSWLPARVADHDWGTHHRVVGPCTHEEAANWLQLEAHPCPMRAVVYRVDDDGSLVLDDAEPSSSHECEECFGTGLTGGFGVPCSRGCSL